jgi:hypothetical protein
MKRARPEGSADARGSGTAATSTTTPLPHAQRDAVFHAWGFAVTAARGLVGEDAVSVLTELFRGAEYTCPPDDAPNARPNFVMRRAIDLILNVRPTEGGGCLDMRKLRVFYYLEALHDAALVGRMRLRGASMSDESKMSKTYYYPHFFGQAAVVRGLDTLQIMMEREVRQPNLMCRCGVPTTVSAVDAGVSTAWDAKCLGCRMPVRTLPIRCQTLSRTGLSTHDVPWHQAQSSLGKKMEGLRHLKTSLSKWMEKATMLHPNMPMAILPELAKGVPRFHAAPLILLPATEREIARKALDDGAPAPVTALLYPDQRIVVDGVPRRLGSITLSVKGEEVAFMDVLRDYQAFYCLMNQSETGEYHRLRRQFDVSAHHGYDASFA